MENMTRTAQEAAEKIPQIAQTATDTIGKAVQNLAENLAPIMDRLAGTQSTMTLRFEDLTLDTGTAKAKITGSINLSASYTEQQKSGSQMQAQSGGTSDKVNFGQIDRTVVNVE